MGIILGWLVFSLLLVMLPFFVVGWLFAGKRPFLTSLVLWGLAVFVFGLWAFVPFMLPFQYLIAVAGYAWGGSVRTGKEVEEVLEQQPNKLASPAFSDEQE